MNVVELKGLIQNNPEYIEKILDYLGCGKIKYLKGNNEIRSAIDNHPSSNGNSIKVNVETVYVVSYSDRLKFKGDIVALVQEFKGCKLNEAIRIICGILGIEYSGYTPSTSSSSMPFGGYWKDIEVEKRDIELKTYSTEVLKQYLDVGCVRFQKDGISLTTQKEFRIMYDILTERITIPWFTLDGKLAGIVGRYNSDDYEKYNEPKYKPIYPAVGFQKSLNVFGLYQNKEQIEKEGVVIISEAEKSTMQLYDMGVKCGVSIGSHNISDTQVGLIHSLQPKKIILAYDEGLYDDFLTKECEKIKQSSIFNECKVGYIFDKNNKHLPKDSKYSPFDLGKDVFQNLVKECIIWI